MNAEAMVTTLKSLKLFGMAESIAELAEQSSLAFRQVEAILGTLLKAEVAERDVRSIKYQMKAAKFPAYRDLAGFDFRQSGVDEALIRSCTAASSWRTPTTWCWWAAPAPARPTSPPPSACRPCSIIAIECAFYPPSE